MCIRDSSYAQTKTSTAGKFTFLQEGAPAPFEGTLFDPVAVADILANKEFEKKTCLAKVDYEKKLLKSDCLKNTNLLKSELEIEKKKYNLILDAQREEIESLRKLAKGEDNTLWATIGFALGAVTSVAIFFAAVEIAQ